MDKSLSCQQVLSLLSDYLDGDLAPETAAQVDAHLASCPNCARFGADVAGMLASMARHEAPVEMPAATREALRIALATRGAV